MQIRLLMLLIITLTRYLDQFIGYFFICALSLYKCCLFRTGCLSRYFNFQSSFGRGCMPCRESVCDGMCRMIRNGPRGGQTHTTRNSTRNYYCGIVAASRHTLISAWCFIRLSTKRQMMTTHTRGQNSGQRNGPE